LPLHLLVQKKGRKKKKEEYKMCWNEPRRGSVMGKGKNSLLEKEGKNITILRIRGTEKKKKKKQSEFPWGNVIWRPAAPGGGEGKGGIFSFFSEGGGKKNQAGIKKKDTSK